MNQEYIKSRTDAQLEEEVFCYPESYMDMDFFLKCISEYAQGHTKFQTFTDCMYNACWVVNKYGKSQKYMHFNERVQKLYLEAFFWEWSKRQLSKIKPLNNAKQLSLI